MFRKLLAAYDHFHQTLVEAHYNAESKTLWNFIFRKKKEVPEAAQLVAGNKMFDLSSKILSKKYVWAPILAIVSLKVQIGLLIGLGTIGAGLVGLEYYRCTKVREDVITEVNFVGQTVRGKRADLCRLHRAQKDIMNVANSFRPASRESTADMILDILEGVKEERARIEVLEAGPHGGSRRSYDFSRPRLSLVAEGSDPFAPVGGTTAPAPALRMGHENAGSGIYALQGGELRQSFSASRPATPDEILDRLAALESALPDDLRSKFRQRLTQTPIIPAVPAALAAPPPRLQQAANA